MIEAASGTYIVTSICSERKGFSLKTAVTLERLQRACDPRRGSESVVITGAFEFDEFRPGQAYDISFEPVRTEAGVDYFANDPMEPWHKTPARSRFMSAFRTLRDLLPRLAIYRQAISALWT
jgi:hypothetical protein